MHRADVSHHGRFEELVVILLFSSDTETANYSYTVRDEMGSMNE